MSMAFPTQCWRGLPFPAPGGLPDLGIKAVSPASLALAGRFLTSAPPGKHSLQSTSFKIEYFHLLLHFKISVYSEYKSFARFDDLQIFSPRRRCLLFSMGL